MAKYLLTDRGTALILGLDNNVQIVQLLANAIEDTLIVRIDPGHPFFPQANKTMMAQKLLTVTPNLAIKDETGNPFPPEVTEKLNLVKLREPIMTRLFYMVANWVSLSSELFFPGMESVVEIELRDCDRSQGVYSANIHFHAEMLGLTPSEAYDQLNAMAANTQRRRMRGMSFIYKYAKMINNVTTSAEAERINALMYEDWTMFREQFTKEKS